MSLKLGIDRTTVGRRVAALEAQLGVPLFTRTRTGLTLTAAGHTAVTRATHMEAEAHALKTEASPPTRVSGVVRLAVTDALGPFVVEQGLLSITDVHPRLRLEVLSGNRRLDLASGEADLALRVDPLKGARLRARCVSRTPITLYAAPGYLGRRGRTGKGLVALTASWGDREAGLERLFDVPGVPPRALWLVSTAEASRHPACIAVSQHLVELFARVRT